VECLSDAEKHLAEYAVDLILLDLGLPDAHGLGAVRRAHAVAPRVPLVVLTSLDDEALAAQALQEGAQDYLIKGQIDGRGLRSLRYAIERKSMEEALFVEKERAQVTLNRVVAEGVETQEELAFLQDHQCDEAQGYYFSQPVLPQEFARLLETGLAMAARQPSEFGPFRRDRSGRA
jgi:DNA-binding response OmpR family regulator